MSEPVRVHVFELRALAEIAQHPLEVDRLERGPFVGQEHASSLHPALGQADRHRLSDPWDELKARMATFFDQFRHGCHELLKYVGLLGEGKFERVLRSEYRT
jgi:hypothetical protein